MCNCYSSCQKCTTLPICCMRACRQATTNNCRSTGSPHHCTPVQSCCQHATIQQRLPLICNLCNKIDKCDGCEHDDLEERKRCRELCKHNKYLIAELANLFNCTIERIKSIILKIAYEQKLPLPRVYRGGDWDIMGGVKAPLCDFYDFIIYDSMYDRCGQPIDPFEPSNTIKVLRLMFKANTLAAYQEQHLMEMLRQLNEHALQRLNIEQLMYTIKRTELISFACSILQAERLTRNFYNARLCAQLCNLYKKVVMPKIVNSDIYKMKRLRQRKRKRDLKRCPKVSDLGIYCVRNNTRETQTTNESTEPQPFMTPMRYMAPTLGDQTTVLLNNDMEGSD